VNIAAAPRHNETLDRVENDAIEPLLNSAQAAYFLGIHRKTLQRIIRSSKVPALRIGKLWRFRKSDLNAWLDSQANLKR
jgi:excisionase family DNA binding protein